MSEHTPGPWQYSFEGSTAAYIVERDGTTVARITVVENSTAHSSLAANARLMASAPDLLSFAQAVVRYAGNSGDVYLADQARAAINKATKGTQA